MTQIGAFAQQKAKVQADVTEKVRKLLTQAEDPAATPEEAAAFTAKAQEMMTKYAISLAMVTDADRIDKVVVKDWRVNNPYAAYKVSLVSAAARANDCRAVYANLGGGAKQIEVLGFPHDVEWVQTLYHSLELQLTTALAAAARTRPRDVHGRTYAVGFVQGFVDEVAARLARARREAVAAAEAARRPAAGGPDRSGSAEAPSVALVLAGKDRQVEDEYRVRFPYARSVRRYVRLQSWDGYQPGRAAGRQARLARAPIGGRRSLSA